MNNSFDDCILDVFSATMIWHRHRGMESRCGRTLYSRRLRRVVILYNLL